MSLLQRALEDAKIQTVPSAEAVPSQHMSWEEARNAAEDYYTTNNMDHLSSVIIAHDLNSNIFLPNGLTLVQDSLLHYPTDAHRLKTLLTLGADANMYAVTNNEESFGDKGYPKSNHPLNYAFTNHPTTSTEICQLLREFGASAHDLLNHKETNPRHPIPDTAEKASLRSTLISITPNPSYVQNTRYGIDILSLTNQAPRIEKTQAITAPLQTQAVFDQLHQLGDFITGKGIYAGIWQPLDRDRMIQNKPVRVFAARHDLRYADGSRSSLIYDDFVISLRNKRNLHSHDCFRGEGQEELYKAIQDGSALGKWFIPPAILLGGHDPGDTSLRWTTSLYDLKDMGAFQGTFSEKHMDKWYWSCTKNRINPDRIYHLNMANGLLDHDLSTTTQLLCRPCRVEACTM